VYVDLGYGSRYIRLKHDPGVTAVQYDATVDIDHFLAPAHELHEMPIVGLPPAALPFIYPSRYCQSDKLRNFAAREFGHLTRRWGWCGSALAAMRPMLSINPIEVPGQKFVLPQRVDAGVSTSC
jgi:hypothetical protein